ncbi:hypothetical protein TNCV_843301 [Trichonephila clavipes]|nr:hypothetical protein TNCV_843301 [Trichonephila clavipes]
MVLKANDRRTSCPCHDEFRGPRSDYVRQVALATTTTVATLLAICETYSLGFIFIKRITKQDSRGDTAVRRPDLSLDVKISVDL